MTELSRNSWPTSMLKSIFDRKWERDTVPCVFGQNACLAILLSCPVQDVQLLSIHTGIGITRRKPLKLYFRFVCLFVSSISCTFSNDLPLLPSILLTHPNDARVLFIDHKLVVTFGNSFTRLSPYVVHVQRIVNVHQGGG